MWLLPHSDTKFCSQRQATCLSTFSNTRDLPLAAEKVLDNKILCPSIFSAAKIERKSKMAVKPLFWKSCLVFIHKMFAAKKMLGHNILLSRTSSAARGKSLCLRKYLHTSCLSTRKFLETSCLSLRSFSTTQFCVRECPRVQYSCKQLQNSNSQFPDPGTELYSDVKC